MKIESSNKNLSSRRDFKPDSFDIKSKSLNDINYNNNYYTKYTKFKSKIKYKLSNFFSFLKTVTNNLFGNKNKNFLIALFAVIIITLVLLTYNSKSSTPKDTEISSQQIALPENSVYQDYIANYHQNASNLISEQTSTVNSVTEQTTVSKQPNTESLSKTLTSVTSTSVMASTDHSANLVNNDNINITKYTRIIKKNDNIMSIFKELNISNKSIGDLIQDKKHHSTFNQLKPGQKLILSYDQSSRNLLSLDYYLDKLQYVTIQKIDNYFVSKTQKIDLSEKVSYAKLSINSSLFEDAQKQKLPLDLIYQIIDIFTWDIDFAQDLRKNDYVEMLYQDYYLDGKKYISGKILAVNFHNNGRTYSALRYQNKEHTGYYTPEGISLRKAFIRTPVKFTRISSKFSMGRNHPVLHKIRAHKGVDYAAPTGTPIKAAGDGKVIFYGRKGGYGKTAIIQHANSYSTLYAHMSNYDKKIRNGGTVKQGDIIGYVGQTGLATGPHLHFEFRVNNQHVNPLTVALPRAIPLNGKNKNNFLSVANHLLNELKQQGQLHHGFSSSSLVAANTKFE